MINLRSDALKSSGWRAKPPSFDQTKLGDEGGRPGCTFIWMSCFEVSDWKLDFSRTVFLMISIILSELCLFLFLTVICTVHGNYGEKVQVFRAVSTNTSALFTRLTVTDLPQLSSSWSISIYRLSQHPHFKNYIYLWWNVRFYRWRHVNSCKYVNIYVHKTTLPSLFHNFLMDKMDGALHHGRVWQLKHIH